jgi:hypothetical protein
LPLPIELPHTNHHLLDLSCVRARNTAQHYPLTAQAVQFLTFSQPPAMDNSSLLEARVHQRKAAAKKTKSKKNNPIKVVYISNPMKVKTSASQFKGLVQELTGQDAEFPDPTKFHGSDGGDVVGHQSVSDHPTMMMKKNIGGDDNDHSREVPVVDPSREPPQFEPLDDVFTPQMIESLSGLLPASVFYDSISSSGCA